MKIYNPNKINAWNSMQGTNGTQTTIISSEVWAEAREFMILWRMKNGTPWRSIIVPKSITKSLYIDSYYYSEDYYASFGFTIGAEDGVTSVVPYSGWSTGKYGTQSLNLSELGYVVYWK